MKEFHLHLVSDATGETVQSVARACLVQFEAAQPTEHIWTLVRNKRQVAEVIQGIEQNPGIVLFTMVNAEIRKILQGECRRLKIPCVSVLQPVMAALTSYYRLSRDSLARERLIELIQIQSNAVWRKRYGASRRRIMRSAPQEDVP